ncbi:MULTISPECIES: MDR family MFS transporter [Streptomyces]|uniref:MDR family MFS transporter n=1 Tax=Streptomyces TaxID=1883 RepID=UPI00099C1088|nr:MULTISPECIES: MDR family MFS transporter [Streptomyces]MBK3585497.1 multidrug efflux MFS transporter [Streptomyces sp. MBT57]QQZ52912.1 multidrug efflux MFS transporter [Streptomyces microflavus]QTA30613.1 export protein [Streptomyces sp. CA-256286]WSR90003.1 multidrug efflux MFS transporter [Streptomyces microflavus]WTF67997.1 multidrug efflux MFS transporter [Streptomyces microflavus]
MSASTEKTAPAEQPPRPIDRQLVLLSATVLVGAIAALLDTTIVAVALDELRREFDSSVVQIQWVTTAYVLAMTAVIPAIGWTVGRFGARTMWTAALAVFLVGSVLCGAAWSVESLIVFRVVQGIGGGMILPLTQITLARAAGPDRLGRVLGVVGLAGQLAPVSGPVLGGVLIATWGWRWVFFVNIPLCLITLVMTWRWFPPDGERSPQRLDVVGLILLPTGVVALIQALSSLEESTPSLFTWLSLAVGIVLLAVFVVRSTRGSGAALLDLKLFTQRAFRSATVMMFLLGITTWGPMFLLPLYYQQLRGLSALDTGFMLAPQSAGLALAYLLISRVTDRTAPRTLAVIGMSVATVGTIPFALATEHTSTLLLGVALFTRGVGVGIASLPISVALYKSLRPEAIPDATAASNVVARIGAATGTALMASVLAAGAGNADGGFGFALVWMLALTGVGLAASLYLPGKR